MILTYHYNDMYISLHHCGVHVITSPPLYGVKQDIYSSLSLTIMRENAPAIFVIKIQLAGAISRGKVGGGGGGGGGGMLLRFIKISSFYHSENMYWVTVNVKIYFK